MQHYLQEEEVQQVTAPTYPAAEIQNGVRSERWRLLCTDLRHGKRLERVRAARALVAYGPESVEALTDALRDSSGKVRIAAAESLGIIGDPRAVRPLTDALRQCFGGRSARWQVVVGMVSLLGLIAAGLFWGWLILKIGFIWFLFLAGSAHKKVEAFFNEKRSQTGLCRAITEALERIAERNPTPELRAVVPDLRAIAADTVHQDPRTRAVSREAADRIQSLTEKVKSLPLTSTAPPVTAESLPRAAAAPDPDAATLPRVDG